ncbi:uncharacterized protein J3D65DRAFT_640869 [Phyllosticta citribraziliensis]|uniref:Nidogen G2 beta-barrel domain-containing protein n=1 Tax=Phyllosticta citribraziliensis TaxID=989973 RepID=A0ABR1L7A9_9PEZI
MTTPDVVDDPGHVMHHLRGFHGAVLITTNAPTSLPHLLTPVVPSPQLKVPLAELSSFLKPHHCHISPNTCPVSALSPVLERQLAHFKSAKLGQKLSPELQSHGQLRLRLNAAYYLTTAMTVDRLSMSMFIVVAVATITSCFAELFWALGAGLRPLHPISSTLRWK